MTSLGLLACSAYWANVSQTFEQERLLQREADMEFIETWELDLEDRMQGLIDKRVKFAEHAFSQNTASSNKQITDFEKNAKARVNTTDDTRKKILDRLVTSIVSAVQVSLIAAGQATHNLIMTAATERNQFDQSLEIAAEKFENDCTVLADLQHKADSAWIDEQKVADSECHIQNDAKISKYFNSMKRSGCTTWSVYYASQIVFWKNI